MGAVDHDVVRELREAAGDEAFIQIRAQFLESARRSAAALRAAADGGDADGLRREAHALRGASGSLGARGLEALCREIESRLKAGAPASDCAALAALADDELAAARAALEAL